MIQACENPMSQYPVLQETDIGGPFYKMIGHKIATGQSLKYALWY